MSKHFTHTVIFFFPTPKEFLDQVWNQLRPWDWSWFFSLGKYILFLRRKAGGREILVKIVPNLLEHEIFEGNNNKHLDKMCIHHSQHTALVYLKNLPFWTTDIFRSLKYTHLSFWGVELNTHVSDIFTIIKVHCSFGWLLVLKYLFEVLKVILQSPFNSDSQRGYLSKAVHYAIFHSLWHFFFKEYDICENVCSCWKESQVVLGEDGPHSPPWWGMQWVCLSRVLLLEGFWWGNHRWQLHLC